MNQEWMYELLDSTKYAVEYINKNSVYSHIPWVTSGLCSYIPQKQVYRNFIENVTDGFIFMPHSFLWSNLFTKQRKELFDKTDVYHIMMNEKHDLETVTIFCKKGKTSNINLSFEEKPKMVINISLPSTQTINMIEYVGLTKLYRNEADMPDINYISFDNVDKKCDIFVEQTVGRTLRHNESDGSNKRARKE